jgi:hypothetical protein
MIEILFYLGTEIILVKVEGHTITFSTSNQLGTYSTIDGLRLNHAGVIKEHPDLKEREDWKAEAVKRFKEKIKSFDSEDKIVDYLIYDLKKYGYVAKFKQRKGHRREAVHE